MRHHPHDGVRSATAVQHDLSPEHAGVPIEPSLPRGVAQHRYRRRAPYVIRGAQRSPQRRARSEHLKELARDECAAQARDPVAVANRYRPGSIVEEERSLLEGPRAPYELATVRETDGIVEGPVRRGPREHYEAVLITDGEAAEQERVGHGEDGRRKTNAQGESENREESNPWRTTEASDADPEVLEQRVQRFTRAARQARR